MKDSKGNLHQKAGDLYKLGFMFEQIIRCVFNDEIEALYERKKFIKNMPK
jgi:hypothetical protein